MYLNMPDDQNAQIALAKRILSLLDLTALSENCSEKTIESLCEKAAGPHGLVAAVCVWPQHVSLAKHILRSVPVQVATVANFPAGGTNTTRALDDVIEALDDGADEIDLVMPWRTFLDGEPDFAREMIENVRDKVQDGRVLKVILETGAFPDLEAIALASRLAIDAGADFLKTSTGKIPVSATPDAVRTMLATILTSGKFVGIKPSGGIRTLDDARGYLDLADNMMGPNWAVPRTFRIGASSLHDALIATITGRPEKPAAKSGY
jgi:deoxyribose-phosphate aldolase